MQKKIAIIENYQGLADYFFKFMNSTPFEVFPVWQTGRFPEQDFDAYILTGDYNNISDGLLPIHKTEIEFIDSIKERKIFASCFAHQLMGHIFGGKVKKRKTRFAGWNKVTIEEPHPVFKGLTEPWFVNFNGDEITRKPKKVRVLATHPECRYQMLQYGENILTCQSHPEIFKQEALDSARQHRKELLAGILFGS
jgi:GMP synthase-like glutamine amidotransferase